MAECQLQLQLRMVENRAGLHGAVTGLLKQQSSTIVDQEVVKAVGHPTGSIRTFVINCASNEVAAAHVAALPALAGVEVLESSVCRAAAAGALLVDKAVPIRPVRPTVASPTAHSDWRVAATPAAKNSLPAPTQCKHMVRGTRQCKRRAAGCGADHTVCDGHQPSKLAASQTESRAAAVAGPATDVQVKKVRRSGFDTEFCIRGCHWVPTPAGFIHLGRPRSYRLMLQPVVQTLKVRKKRVSSSQKRMLNPFSFRPLPSAMIDGAVAHYTNPCLPLVVDIGSAQGRFIRRLNSSVGVGANHLGVELRNFLMEAATTAVRSLVRLPCLDGHPWWKLPPLQCVLSCGCLA